MNPTRHAPEGVPLHVVLGTGPLGRATAESLLAQRLRVRLVNRSGSLEASPPGAEVVAADAREAEHLARVLEGASAVYQCAQPAYHRWAEEFPALQRSVVEASARAGAVVVAAENLYAYGRPQGRAFTESTPFAPCSRKGEVRAQMTHELFEAHDAGKVRAVSVRGSDFWGPWERIQGNLVFRAALEGRPVSLLGRLDQPHSFTYVKDFGRALATAGTDPRAWGQPWHVPSGPALTQQQWVDELALALGRKVAVRAAGKALLTLVGLFDPTVRELREMLYEFEAPFVLDGSAMETTFGLVATPFAQRVDETLAWVRAYGAGS